MTALDLVQRERHLREEAPFFHPLHQIGISRTAIDNLYRIRFTHTATLLEEQIVRESTYDFLQKVGRRLLAQLHPSVLAQRPESPSSKGNNEAWQRVLKDAATRREEIERGLSAIPDPRRAPLDFDRLMLAYVPKDADAIVQEEQACYTAIQQLRIERSLRQFLVGVDLRRQDGRSVRDLKDAIVTVAPIDALLPPGRNGSLTSVSKLDSAVVKAARRSLVIDQRGHITSGASSSASKALFSTGPMVACTLRIDDDFPLESMLDYAELRAGNLKALPGRDGRITAEGRFLLRDLPPTRLADLEPFLCGSASTHPGSSLLLVSSTFHPAYGHRFTIEGLIVDVVRLRDPHGVGLYDLPPPMQLSIDAESLGLAPAPSSRPSPKNVVTSTVDTESAVFHEEGVQVDKTPLASLALLAPAVLVDLPPAELTKTLALVERQAAFECDPTIVKGIPGSEAAFRARETGRQAFIGAAATDGSDILLQLRTGGGETARARHNQFTSAWAEYSKAKLYSVADIVNTKRLPVAREIKLEDSFTLSRAASAYKNERFNAIDEKVRFLRSSNRDHGYVTDKDIEKAMAERLPALVAETIQGVRAAIALGTAYLSVPDELRSKLVILGARQPTQPEISMDLLADFIALRQLTRTRGESILSKHVDRALQQLKCVRTASSVLGVGKYKAALTLVDLIQEVRTGFQADKISQTLRELVPGLADLATGILERRQSDDFILEEVLRAEELFIWGACAILERSAEIPKGSARTKFEDTVAQLTAQHVPSRVRKEEIIRHNHEMVARDLEEEREEEQQRVAAEILAFEQLKTSIEREAAGKFTSQGDKYTGTFRVSAGRLVRISGTHHDPGTASILGLLRVSDTEMAGFHSGFYIKDGFYSTANVAISAFLALERMTWEWPTAAQRNGNHFYLIGLVDTEQDKVHPALPELRILGRVLDFKL